MRRSYQPTCACQARIPSPLPQEPSQQSTTEYRSNPPVRAVRTEHTTTTGTCQHTHKSTGLPYTRHQIKLLCTTMPCAYCVPAQSAQMFCAHQFDTSGGLLCTTAERTLGYPSKLHHRQHTIVHGAPTILVTQPPAAAALPFASLPLTSLSAPLPQVMAAQTRRRCHTHSSTSQRGTKE